MSVRNFCGLGATGQDFEPVPAQVLVGSLAAGHREDQRLERPDNLRSVAVVPIGVGGS